MHEYISSMLRSAYGRSDVTIRGIHEGSQCVVWEVCADGEELGVRRTYLTDENRYASVVLITHSLHNAGFTTIAPLATVHGDWVYRHDGALYSVYRWLSGKTRGDKAFPLEGAERLGAQLGRIHLYLARFGPLLPLRTRRFESRNAALEKVEHLIRVMQAREISSSRDQLALLGLAYKREWLSRVDEIPSWIISLYDRPQLIHGDFQIGNILVDPRGRRFMGLLDLESYHFGPRIWDIVKACMFSFGGRIDHCMRFLKGYHRRTPLTVEEIEAFFPLALDYMLKANWTFEEYILRGSPHTNLRDSVACHRYLVANEARFRAAWATRCSWTGTSKR